MVLTKEDKLYISEEKKKNAVKYKKQGKKTPRKPKYKNVAPYTEDNYIGESKNKEYIKTKEGKKTIIISKDKKTGSEKILTTKQFNALKKKTSIIESTKKLTIAHKYTNQQKAKGFKWFDKDKDEYFVYKKYAQANPDKTTRINFLKVRLEFDKDGNVTKEIPIKILTNKQALTAFRQYRKEKSIRMLQMKGYNRKEAQNEYNRIATEIKAAQINNIMQRTNYNTVEKATSYYNSLKRRGRNDLLDKYTY